MGPTSAEGEPVVIGDGARFEARHPGWLTLTLFAAIISAWGLVTQAGSVGESRPPDAWLPPPSALELVAQDALLAIELAVPAFLVVGWFFLGLPSLRVAEDRRSAVPLALLSVFVWWSCTEEVAIAVLRLLPLSDVDTDLAWWGISGLALAGLHLAALGGLRRHLRGGWSTWAVLAGVACSIVPLLATQLWYAGVDAGLLPPEAFIPSAAMASDPVRVGLDIGVTVALAPVVEEFAYRGLLLEGLRGYLPDAVALVLSSLVFAVMHDYALEGTVLMTVIGLVLGLLRLRTGSLLAPLACHVTINVLAVSYDLLPLLTD